MKIQYSELLDIKEESHPKIDIINKGNIIVNDKGLYGDWVIEKFATEDILKYPTKAYLEQNINNIIKQKPIIALLKSQKEEIKLLKDIFPRKKIHLDMELLFEALDLNIDMGSLWQLAKKNNYYRILYLVMRYRFNPSYIFTLDQKNPQLPYEKEIKKLDLQLTHQYTKYGDIAGQTFQDVILDLAYIDDLMLQNTDLKTIINQNQISKETRDWLLKNNKIKEDW